MNKTVSEEKNKLPWVDKYRPSKLDDILSQDHVISFLKNCVKERDIQHLLFYGQSGVGKCFHPDTEILMHNGNIKKIKDINPGDILIGNNGRKKKYVTSITNGCDDMYEISSDSIDSFIVNSPFNN